MWALRTQKRVEGLRHITARVAAKFVFTIFKLNYLDRPKLILRGVTFRWFYLYSERAGLMRCRVTG